METEDHENRKLNKSGETSNLENSSDCSQELMAELTVFSREKELAKVTIKKEDVELIVSFFNFLSSTCFSRTAMFTEKNRKTPAERSSDYFRLPVLLATTPKIAFSYFNPNISCELRPEDVNVALTIPPWLNSVFPPPVLLQMSEMEISRSVAERSLREHMGNVVEALVALTN